MGCVGRTPDPVTGQAAWFDLRVKIEKAEQQAESSPRFEPITSPVEKGPNAMQWKVGE
jgi:hypothetical protein